MFSLGLGTLGLLNDFIEVIAAPISPATGITTSDANRQIDTDAGIPITTSN